MSRAIRVLHVDDDESFTGLCADILEADNDRFEVVTAHSARKALDVLQADQPEVDCVVCDYRLPERSGLDVLEAVRAARPALPFILLTGRGSEAVAGEAISAGVTDYIQKEDTVKQFSVLAQRIENSVSEYRARREAERSSRRLEELTANTTDCLWLFSRDWDELLFISGYEEVWDRPTEAIKGEPQEFLESVHDEDRAFVEGAMERLSSGESVDIEYRIRKGGGESGWVWVKGEPIRDDEGTVVRIAGFTRDITERKQRERELELRTQAMNEAPIGIVMSDPSLDDNPLIYANERFLELTGYPREEVLGRNCRFLQGEETSESTVAAMREGIANEELVTTEVRNYRKDGTPFWNRVSIAPVYAGGDELSNYIGFQETVTERKQREQQLQVLDRILRHNLRNKVSIIRSRAETIHSNREDGVSVHTDHIVETCDELMDIAEKERLITQSLSEQRQQEKQLGLTLRQAATNANRDYPDASIDIDCPGDLVLSTSPYIEYALEELLTNAVGHADTSSPEATVTVTPGDETVRIEIEDAGPSIPAMERDVLHGHERTPLYHGGGLGLWFVNLVVTQSGGTIQVEDNERDGNTVRLELPN